MNVQTLFHSKNCLVIAKYVDKGRHHMPDDVRQRLLPYLPRIAGSRSETHEAARARLLQLAALRIFAPRALDAAGLHEHAARLRALPDDVDMEVAAAAAYAAERAALGALRATGVVVAAWAAMAAGAAVRAAVAPALAATAACAAVLAAAGVGPWNDYFDVLDAVLNAGPQGGSPNLPAA